MKKICSLIIIVLTSFFFIPGNIYAIDTLKVSFKTNFSSDIDIDNIGSIIIMMDDASNKSHDIELTRDNNYSYEIPGLINGRVNIDMIFVERDYSGKYDITYKKNNISANELEIAIDVNLSIKNPSTNTTNKVNDAILADIFGDKYVEKITEPLDEMGTEEGYDENNIPTNNGSNTSTSPSSGNSSTSNVNGDTTTNSNGDTQADIEKRSSRLEEQRKKAQKEEEVEKRNNLYKIILIVAILVLLIAIIFVAIKFANANK